MLYDKNVHILLIIVPNRYIALALALALDAIMYFNYGF